MSALGHVRKFLQHAGECRRVYGRDYSDLFLDFFRIIKNGYYPSEYFGLKLYEGGLSGYISNREGIAIERDLNPRMVGIINFDKWQQYCFFRANGFPTPRVFALFVGRRVLISDVSFAFDDPGLFPALARLGTPFVVKPYGGGHGEGFGIVDTICEDERAIVFRGRGSLGYDEWITRTAGDPEGLLAQELLKTHNELLRFGESALNTLRVVTIRDSAGVAHAAAVLLKLARAGALVDNIGAGALAANVDLDSGKLSKAFLWPGYGAWAMHPDTGAEIEGFTVPFWQEAVGLAICAHERLTSGGSLSWDVAITNDGPMLLEMNAFTPRPVYQKLNRGLMLTVYGDVLRAKNNVF